MNDKKEYIERKAVLDMLDRYFHNLEDNESQVLISDIKQATLELPATSAEEIKLKAIREYVDALKETFPNNTHWVKPREKVDNLVKEMVGED